VELSDSIDFFFEKIPMRLVFCPVIHACCSGAFVKLAYNLKDDFIVEAANFPWNV
jgi:hypothetical protein